MRALIFDGTQASLDAKHPEPRPKPGEAVVRTVRAAVSATDRRIALGLNDFRGVLGHEFVGVVESVEGGNAGGKAAGGKAAGGNADGLVGSRVVGAVTVRCGRCDMCQAGLGAHCRTRSMLGMQGRDGCLAERFTLPVANLVRVPDDVDDDHAVFAGVLAAAIQAARQLTIEGKPYITVLGDGPLGLLTVQVMAQLNASVRLVGRHGHKLAVCEKWGIKHRLADDVGRRADQDIVVDCSGTSSGLQLAMQLVRPRGTILLKSLMPPMTVTDEPIDLSPIVLNEITLIGSHHGPLSEAVAALQRRDVDVVSLISGRAKLDDGAALLNGVQHDSIKMLVNV